MTNLRFPLLCLLLAAALPLAAVRLCTGRGSGCSDAGAHRDVVALLDRCGRNGGGLRRTADLYAERAMRERRPEESALFRAIALSEGIREESCAQAVRRLGGHYRPAAKLTIVCGTTDSNLRRLLERTLQEEIPGRADGNGAVKNGAVGNGVAGNIAAGNGAGAGRYAGQILDRAAACRLRRIVLLRRLAEPGSGANSGSATEPGLGLVAEPGAATGSTAGSAAKPGSGSAAGGGYEVCRRCGWIAAARHAAGCPQCGASRRMFLRVRVSDLDQSVLDGVDH